MRGLPVDAEVASRHDDGTPNVVRLGSDATLSGVPCLAGEVRLHPGAGVLAAAKIAKPWMPGEYSFERGDAIVLRDDLTIASVTLARSRPFAGVPAADAVDLTPDGSVERLRIGDRVYDAEGRLRARSIEAPMTVDGFVCAAGVVRFHANARLESAELGAPTSTPYGVLPRGSLINLDDGGRLVRAHLREEVTLATTHFTPGTTVRFDPDALRPEPSWRFPIPDHL